MGLWAIILIGAYMAVTFGVRTVIQYRLTGSAGFHGVHGSLWSVDGAAAILIVLAALGVVAAPVLDLFGALSPITMFDNLPVRVVGFVLFVIGFAVTFAAQMNMGASWRVGVNKDEVTTLVTRGLFTCIRNPIFTGMMTASASIAFLVPNVVALGSFILMVVALELHVRCVEEPHLRRVHGDTYARYAAKAGRFVPLLGTLHVAANSSEGKL